MTIEAASKRVVIVLGAGASAGCDNGTGVIDEKWRPPLARQLFANAPPVHEHLANHLNARFIQSTQRDLSDGSEIDLERRLLELARDPVFARQFTDIPLFLRDYLLACSERFLSGRSETYGTLVTRLMQMGYETAYISLNYDTFIEQAITGATSHSFNQIGDYVARSPMVIKPHGSVDWVRLYPRNQESNADILDRIAQGRIDPSGASGDLALYRMGTPTRLLPVYLRRGSDANWVVRTENMDGAIPAWAYPALTVPLAEKERRDVIAPEYHLAALKAFQSACTKYVFIGMAGWDTHVLQLIGEGCPTDRIRIGTVNMGDKRATTRIVEGIQAARPDGAPISVTTNTDGFTDWVYGGGLDRFLT